MKKISLADIAKNDEDSDVRKVAVEKLTNQDFLDGIIGKWAEKNHF